MLIDLCRRYQKLLVPRRSNRTRDHRTYREHAAALVEVLEPRQVLSVAVVGPVITEPATLSMNQDTTATFTGANTISISDLVPATEQFTAVVVHGTLTVNPTIGVTAAGSGTGTLSLSGSVANVNAALATLSYRPTAGYSGTDNLGLYLLNSVDQLSDNGAVAITINPTTVAAPPVITAPMSATVTQGVAYDFSGVNGISLTDNTSGTEQFSMAVQHGTLTLATTTGLTVSGNGTGTVLISGGLSNLNAALATLRYQSTSGYTGNDYLGMYVMNSTSNLSASAGIAISVTTSNGSPPVFTAPSAASVGKNTTFPFTGANSISVADSTAGTEQYSIVVTHGVLNFSSTAGMTISGNNSGTVIMSGSLANLNAALASLTYQPTTDYTGSDTLTMTVNNTVTNKAAYAKIDLTVLASNGTAPTITAPVLAAVLPTTNLAFTGINAISVADTTGGIEQFSMAVLHGTLTVSTTTGLTVSGNGSGTVLISGTLDNLNAALATLVYQKTPNFTGTDNLGLYVLNSISNLSANAGVLLVVS